MVQYSEDVLNNFVAPGISNFTRADIPDLTGNFPHASRWPVMYFFNSAFGMKFKNDGTRQAALAFLRRAQHAFSIYHRARELTLEYLDGNDVTSPRIGKYYAAASEWENFAIQALISIDLFKWLNDGQGAFARNDGSKEQRLYKIATEVKHLPGAIESQRCTSADLVPLWLTNDGLASFQVTITYSEAADVLADIARLADELQNPSAFRKPAP